MKLTVSMHLPYFNIMIGVLLFSFQSCDNEPLDDGDVTGANLDTDDTAISLENELQISDFIWQGLNEYYYWQEEMEDLADSKKEDAKAYAQYINNNSEPKTFFESLNHPDDRFSWIQDDYLELENSLQGIFATNGVEFSLLYACENCSEVVGFVKYILKDSNAEGKNINRGDLFNGVNGTLLNVSNYRSLLFGDELNYTLNMAKVENGSIISNGINIELDKIENFEVNPVQINKVLNTSVGNIGYLMYNQFVASKSNDLNKIFADFKKEGINDLIIDLRYNSGGSVKNCIELASMITGQFKDEIFSKEEWNTKLDEFLKVNYGPESLINRFVNILSDGEGINSLQLNRLYVLTSSESASASELLINGLSPLIEVIQIGERTLGKNVGSITVYDYIDNDKTKNPDHRYAMQPIVLKIANSIGFSDYTDGLEPFIEVQEDLKNLGVLGEQEESFLATALSLITGTAKRNILKAEWDRSLLINDPLMLKRQRMIIEKNFSFPAMVN